MGLRALLVSLSLLAAAAAPAHARAPLRKIGEMDLSLPGVSAIVDPPQLTVPKNIATGVQAEC